MDELQQILEREVRELACRVLSEPERPTLDRSTEADVGVRLRSQERMFSWVPARLDRLWSGRDLFSGLGGERMPGLDGSLTLGFCIQLAAEHHREAGEK